MTEQQAREFSVALGAEIAFWRKRRQLTREALAEKVGTSATTVGRIERGSEDAAAASSQVWRIARALNLSFSDLVRRAEEAVELSDSGHTFPKVAKRSSEKAGASEFEEE